MERFAFFCKRTKHSHIFLHSLQKKVAFFAFFAFFYILCALFRSLEQNGKEWNVLLGLISCQKLGKEQKRTECSLKEWERTERSERKRRRCPTLHFCQTRCHLFPIKIFFCCC